MIAELGLRYRPSAQADLAEHAASLALLASDVADIPPDYLDRAIKEHVRKSHFMPKASELVALAQSYVVGPGMKGSRFSRMSQLAEQGNVKLLAEGRRDIHWIVENDELKLVDAA